MTNEQQTLHQLQTTRSRLLKLNHEAIVLFGMLTRGHKNRNHPYYSSAVINILMQLINPIEQAIKEETDRYPFFENPIQAFYFDDSLIRFIADQNNPDMSFNPFNDYHIFCVTLKMLEKTPTHFLGSAELISNAERVREFNQLARIIKTLLPERLQDDFIEPRETTWQHDWFYLEVNGFVKLTKVQIHMLKNLVSGKDSTGTCVY